MYKKSTFVLQKAICGEKMIREERIEGILTVLACRSAGVPEDMLPLPQNYEEILDFGEEPVKDLKSKQQILKFNRNWSDIVEEEEMRQENALKVDLEKQKIRPQTTIFQEMLKELKVATSNKIQKKQLMEADKAKWKAVLNDLMIATSNRIQRKQLTNAEKAKWKAIHDELKIKFSVAEASNKSQRIELMKAEKTKWKAVLDELMIVTSNRIQRKQLMNAEKAKWKAVYAELMVVVSNRIHRKLLVEAEKAKWSAVYNELLTKWYEKKIEEKQRQKQREFVSEMLKELQREVSSKNERTLMIEKVKTVWTLIHQEMMGVTSNRMRMHQQMELEKTKWKSVHKELMEVALKEVYKRAMKERVQKMWAPVYQELMRVWSKMKLERMQIQQQKELIRNMLTELKKTVDAKTEKYKGRKLESVMRSFDKDDTCNHGHQKIPVSDEIETFVPRKLFLFNIETFKIIPKQVEVTQRCSNSDRRINGCTPIADEKCSLPKKKTLRAKIKKFFGFK